MTAVITVAPATRTKVFGIKGVAGDGVAERERNLTRLKHVTACSRLEERRIMSTRLKATIKYHYQYVYSCMGKVQFSCVHVQQKKNFFFFF